MALSNRLVLMLPLEHNPFWISSCGLALHSARAAFSTLLQDSATTTQCNARFGLMGIRQYLMIVRSGCTPSRTAYSRPSHHICVARTKQCCLSQQRATNSSLILSRMSGRMPLQMHQQLVILSGG